MKPYYQDNYATIIHGDCREIMPGLDKVDLVLTDPPYKQEFANGGGLMTGARFKTHKEILVSVGSSPHFDISEYIPLILDACCTALIWCSCKQLPQLLGFVRRRFNVLVWAKTNPVPLCNNKMLNDAEYCICFLGDKFSYPDVPIELKRTVINMKNGQDASIDHPTVKPLPLIVRNVECFSTPTTTILDPFMGSGTTLRAAKDLRRKSIGIELEEKYCEIAAKRLQQEVLAL